MLNDCLWQKAFNHSLVETIGETPPTFFAAFWSLLASFSGILVISVISAFATADKNFNILFAFAGASAVLLYAIPQMPAAQPRHMIFGHVISSVVSVTVRIIFGGNNLIWLQAPISVSFSVSHNYIRVIFYNVVVGLHAYSIY